MDIINNNEKFSAFKEPIKNPFEKKNYSGYQSGIYNFYYLKFKYQVDDCFFEYRYDNYITRSNQLEFDNQLYDLQIKN